MCRIRGIGVVLKQNFTFVSMEDSNLSSLDINPSEGFADVILETIVVGKKLRIAGSDGVTKLLVSFSANNCA